jgi:hypothetical protein
MAQCCDGIQVAGSGRRQPRGQQCGADQNDNHHRQGNHVQRYFREHLKPHGSLENNASAQPYDHAKRYHLAR